MRTLVPGGVRIFCAASKSRSLRLVHRQNMSFRTSAHAGVGISIEFGTIYRHPFVGDGIPVPRNSETCVGRDGKPVPYDAFTVGPPNSHFPASCFSRQPEFVFAGRTFHRARRTFSKKPLTNVKKSSKIAPTFIEQGCEGKSKPADAVQRAPVGGKGYG